MIDVAGRSKHGGFFRKDMLGRAVSAAGTHFKQVGRLVA